MPETHALRRNRLRDVLASRDIPAALITDLVNVRYLTGFTGSNAVLLVGADGLEVLGTDGRYITQSAQQAPDIERLIERALASTLLKRARDSGAGRIGFESHVATVDLHNALTKAADTAELVSIARAVESLRTVKDDGEIDLLRRACAIADEAFAALLAAGGVRPGRSEHDVARDLDARMLDLGAEAISFDTIVASGENSAIPHHEPTMRELRTGDFVKFDFGATFEGYHSDMTRTLMLGEPADWQREIYDLVADSQRLGREALAVGAVTGELDKISRDRIAEAGYGDTYTHSLGHGVGLEIHEAPTLAAGVTDTLAAGTPVTVEPGVYLEGRGGVRIEDTLVVAADGVELLTRTTKDLIVL